MGHFDVAVLGAGFGGSLLAMVLRQLGMSVLILDRQVHPRFAIGESSTPAADFVLEALSERYSLPRLRPLARYGSWIATYPEISRGLKRGFSYFHHTPGRTFETDGEHSHELLVAASESDDVSDTHWYRPDVDAFFAAEAVRLGAILEEGVEVQVALDTSGWAVRSGKAGAPAQESRARFLVDASGPGGIIPRALEIADLTSELETNSRSVYGHFVDLPLWERELDALRIPTDDYPFPCDDAALHHILDQGWMWVLRFENGITSAGFALDVASHPLREELTPADEFQQRLNEYPSLTRLFAGAKLANSFPGRSPLRTRRMQRMWSRAAGENWCLLPNAAGFIDPFYSTGIAQTLCGVLRLGEAFQFSRDPRAFAERLQEYDATVQAELRLVDRMVALAYRAMGACPEVLHAATAVYFAAATTFEQRFRSGDRIPAFLLADEPAFRSVLARVESLTKEPANFAERSARRERLDEIAREIRHYNLAGLLDGASRRMYRRTAAR